MNKSILAPIFKAILLINVLGSEIRVKACPILLACELGAIIRINQLSLTNASIIMWILLLIMV